MQAKESIRPTKVCDEKYDCSFAMETHDCSDEEGYVYNVR